MSGDESSPETERCPSSRHRHPDAQLLSDLAALAEDMAEMADLPLDSQDSELIERARKRAKEIRDANHCL